MNLSAIPRWVWIAGGGIVIVGALMFTQKRPPSENLGQSSPFTDVLGQMMNALSNLQQDFRNATGPSGAGGSAGSGTSGPASSGTGTDTSGASASSSDSFVDPGETQLEPLGAVLGSFSLQTTPIAPTGHLSTSSATAEPIVKAPIAYFGPLTPPNNLVKSTAATPTQIANARSLLPSWVPGSTAISVDRAIQIKHEMGYPNVMLGMEGTAERARIMGSEQSFRSWLSQAGPAHQASVATAKSILPSWVPGSTAPTPAPAPVQMGTKAITPVYVAPPSVTTYTKPIIRRGGSGGFRPE